MFALLASPALIMSAIAALMVISAVVYTVYQLFFSPLSRFPGPFWAKLSDFGMLLMALEGDANRHFVSLHKRFGTVVRVGPNTL